MSDLPARFETLAIHAGQHPDPVTGAVMTPVYLTSTYAQSAPGEHKGYEYSRTQNLTRHALQDCLAALEGARHGLAFASVTLTQGPIREYSLVVALYVRSLSQSVRYASVNAVPSASALSLRVVLLRRVFTGFGLKTRPLPLL